MSKEKRPESDEVTMVADPFSLPLNEVYEAQQEEGELKLDEEADRETLEGLSRAMKEEEARREEELESLAPTTEEQARESAEKLAAQIAEDDALAQELAREAAEQAAEAESGADEALAQALPRVDENGKLDQAEVESCIETLLFMSDKPISLEKLREWIGPDFPYSVFQEAITSLATRYQAVHHGFELAQVAGGYQFRTKPGRAALAKKLAKVQTQRLSTGAMETLAIVAYRQPVMKEDIDKVRGVDSSHFIRTLLERKLIQISGRSELPGRPMLYATTSEFLQLFGLKELSALPSLRELEQIATQAPLRATDETDPRILEMRRLVGEMKADSNKLNYDPKEDEQFLKEIRERVNSIPSSTPYLDEQKALEKAAAELAAQQAAGLAPAPGAAAEPTGELPLGQ